MLLIIILGISVVIDITAMQYEIYFLLYFYYIVFIINFIMHNLLFVMTAEG